MVDFVSSQLAVIVIIHDKKKQFFVYIPRTEGHISDNSRQMFMFHTYFPLTS